MPAQVRVSSVDQFAAMFAAMTSRIAALERAAGRGGANEVDLSDEAPVTLAAGWEPYDAGETSWPHAKVVRTGRHVVMEGLIRRSTGAATFTSGDVATVPAGFRPDKLHMGFYLTSTSVIARVDTYNTGTLTASVAPAISLAPGAWLSLSGSWAVA